ncbi:hypothetical protein MRS44_013717 [Fusarium solani]|uniref:uncharacterized protein n=1 Tax=Fusarium solani TaxID=169388 RepID=UPI0032C3F5EC|nr:hypothetical protein MRS44_013717 [Fusarium solani]
MHSLFSLRRQKSSSYGSYPDSSDDEGYGSEDRGRPRAWSLSRQSFDLGGPARGHRLTSHSEMRRAQSLDRPHHYHHRSRPESSRRARHDGRKRHDESEPQSQRKLEHAINAAIDAAALEAFQLRKEPGEWTGAKGMRVATAAVGAAVLDATHDGHPDRHSKRTLAKSTLGGLLVNRLLNGSRQELRYRRY